MTLNWSSIKIIGTLRRKGYSYKEISKKLKISPSTSYKYSYKISISKKAKRRLNLRIKENYLKFKKKYSPLKKIYIKHKRISIEKARILSHCFWDGCVSKGTIRYVNTSKNLVIEFKRDMLEVYGVFPDKEYTLIRKNRMLLYIVDYYSKVICDDLLKYSPSFSTSSSISKIPKQILINKNKSILKEFLRVLWEDEGSISCYDAIRVKIKGKRIRDQLIKLHKRFEIKLTPYKEKDKYYGIYIQNSLQNLKKFNEVCFRKASVVAGKNKGKLKYEVFSSLLNKERQRSLLR